jgi:hypothetical protein
MSAAASKKMPMRSTAARVGDTAVAFVGVVGCSAT